MNSLIVKYWDQIKLVLRSTLLFSAIFLLVSYLKEGILNGRTVAFALLLGFIISLFFRILFSALAKKEADKTKK